MKIKDIFRLSENIYLINNVLRIKFEGADIHADYNDITEDEANELIDELIRDTLDNNSKKMEAQGFKEIKE